MEGRGRGEGGRGWAMKEKVAGKGEGVEEGGKGWVKKKNVSGKGEGGRKEAEVGR